MNKLKKLNEQRAEQQRVMDELINSADSENRALTADEIAKFDAAEAAIKAIDETISREERARKDVISRGGNAEMEERAARDSQMFSDYVLGRVTEMRTGEQNVSMGNNGAIIPTTIAHEIIKEVKDRCPILEGAKIYRTKGKLKIPVWGKANTTHMDSIDMLLGCGKKLTEIPTAEVEVSRLTEMAGESFVVRIRALTAREFDELPKDDFRAHVILKATIDPELADIRIADMLKPASRSARLTPVEVVNALFLPGEVINLYNAITDLSGFGEESIKNIRKN